MGKRYIMFVDERGFLNSGRNKNMTMIGVIFEYNYCINVINNECELSIKINNYKKEIFGESGINVAIDDILLKDNVFKSVDKFERNIFINKLSLLFKSLKFTIISSTIKLDSNRVNDSYYILTKKLLKKFNLFITRKNAEAGGIILEARKEAALHLLQQNFFDIYRERNVNHCIMGDMHNKINSFIICQKNYNKYGLGIEVLNALNNVLYRVYNGYREIDSKLISYLEYGNKNKIFNIIKHKIYNDLETGISNKQFQKNSYNNIGIISKELIALKEQLKLKDIKINEKEKEINELNNEIKVLNKHLGEALYSEKNDSLLAKFISDIDSKMKSFDKVTVVTTGSKS